MKKTIRILSGMRSGKKTNTSKEKIEDTNIKGTKEEL